MKGGESMNPVLAAFFAALITFFNGHQSSVSATTHAQAHEEVSVTPSVTPSVSPSVSPSIAPSVTPSVTPSVSPRPSEEPEGFSHGEKKGFFQDLPLGFFVSEHAKVEHGNTDVSEQAEGKE